MGIAVLFPGQGTQVPRMGQPWRAHPAWSIVESAESILGEHVGDLLLHASDEELTRTRNAQLAVMLASLVAWEAVRAELPVPVTFAGHSLGQITALVAAGILDVEDGVRLAASRAECTQAAADRNPGSMAALMGATLEQAEEACAGGDCWVANDNAPGQVVVGGTPAGVTAAGEKARQMGVRRVMHLSVGGAFHTPLMSDARESLVPILDAVSFQPGSVQVVSNLDAQPHGGGAEWRSHLADHLVSPVRWRESMRVLAGLGADTFVEVGPGKVLGGLARRTVPTAQIQNVSVPEDVIGLRKAAKMEVA